MIGAGRWPPWRQCMNMIYDRDIDAVMEADEAPPTRDRSVSVRGAMIFAAALEVAAFLLLWQTVKPASAALAVSATAFYVLVYTMWLKRSSSENMSSGAPGAVPVWSVERGDRLARLGADHHVRHHLLVDTPHFWALAVKYRATTRRPRCPCCRR